MSKHTLHEYQTNDLWHGRSYVTSHKGTMEEIHPQLEYNRKKAYHARENSKMIRSNDGDPKDGFHSRFIEAREGTTSIGCLLKKSKYNER